MGLIIYVFLEGYITRPVFYYWKVFRSQRALGPIVSTAYYLPCELIDKSNSEIRVSER